MKSCVIADAEKYPFITQRGHRYRYSANKIRYAHRESWEMAHGAIPEGMVVAHECDNPPCVEITHLWLGTYADNTRDMVFKGRHFDNRGEKHPSARLSDLQVREIREKFKDSCIKIRRGARDGRMRTFCEEQAKLYPAAPETISKIIRGHLRRDAEG